MSVWKMRIGKERSVYAPEVAILVSYFFMTRNSVWLLPRPAGLSLAGRAAGYSSKALGRSGTAAVKARYTRITLGWAVTLLGVFPK